MASGFVPLVAVFSILFFNRARSGDPLLVPTKRNTKQSALDDQIAFNEVLEQSPTNINEEREVSLAGHHFQKTKGLKEPFVIIEIIEGECQSSVFNCQPKGEGNLVKSTVKFNEVIKEPTIEGISQISKDFSFPMAAKKSKGLMKPLPFFYTRKKQKEKSLSINSMKKINYGERLQSNLLEAFNDERILHPVLVSL